jgi:hypothetical protein
MVVACAAKAELEPPEETPRANATEATPANSSAPTSGMSRQREMEAFI